jgi:putative phage-type endonuclease
MTVSDRNFAESRRIGLGGSDIGAVMGLNPYKTAHQVYLEKVEGYTEDLSENEAVRRGIIFEQPTADLYTSITGKEVYCSGTFTHKEYPFLIANPDRIIPTENRGLEIKTVGYSSKNQWGASGTQLIPEHYYMQIAHYMFVLDYQYWDVAALFPNYEVGIYSFERNHDIDKIILECGEQFWKGHVEMKTPPPIDFTNPNAKDMLKSMYKSIEQETVILDEELLADCATLKVAKTNLVMWESTRKEAEAKILNAMKNATVGILKNGDTFVRKLIKRKEYTVKANEYIQLSYKPAKEGGNSNVDIN